jgi:hypothetical protein
LEDLGIYKLLWRAPDSSGNEYTTIQRTFLTFLLVDARQIKYVPGHKTDEKNSESITKLLIGGLLKGSLVTDQHTK